MSRKISEFLPTRHKSEVDGKVIGLSSKTKTEIIELISRQKQLLSNISFVTRLPDKGEKIAIFLHTLETTLAAKIDEETTCNLFNKLNLNGIGKDALQDIEWKGKLDDNDKTYVDSDDGSDAEDLLSILSQKQSHVKTITHVKPERKLITENDLTEIESFTKSSTSIGHINYVIANTEEKHNKNEVMKGSFKPYKTTKSNVHDPEKEILRKKHKFWEVTAATPPPVIHGPAQILSIEESLKLQKAYTQQLKAVEAKHAAEKLLTNRSYKIGPIPAETLEKGRYREVDSEASDASNDEGSDNEVHDEEPERGGVIFTVMN